MSIDLTLERIRKVHSALPPYTRPTIHIAGTNGKGSTAALISSILSSSIPPLSVGRFNSPHLTSVHDCIVVDDCEVQPEVYDAAKGFVEKVVADTGLDISNFELLTLTALVVFERANVDIVVLEVGMGGRLDATNVIADEVVAVSALTAVDLDHQAFLGNTVAAIAREKASIARKGKPFVLGRQKHPEIESVCRAVIQDVGGEFFEASTVPALTGERPISCRISRKNPQLPPPQPVQLHMSCFPVPVNVLLPLHGEHQLDNLGLAASIISILVSHSSCAALHLSERVTPETIARGIANVRWRGRLSFHSFINELEETQRLLILADGAHNSGSATTLGAYIKDLCRMSTLSGQHSLTLTYILALSHSPPKTPLQTLSPLLPPNVPTDFIIKTRVAVLRFSPPEGMPWVKSVPPSELRDTVQVLCTEADIWFGRDDSTEDLPEALKWAGICPDDAHLVVVAGSLYLVADLYRLLQ